jgi:hypothetical protein
MVTSQSDKLDELEIKLLKASTVYHANRKSAAAARTAGDLQSAADLDELTAEAWRRVVDLRAQVEALRSGKPSPTEGGAA